MPTEIENINPNVYGKRKEREVTANEEDEDVPDPFDTREIFGMYLFTLNLIENFIIILLQCNIRPYSQYQRSGTSSHSGRAARSTGRLNQCQRWQE